ncbi:MAG TPA: hypothetical protein VNX15_11500, partial [Gemmatimonadales bacterium]|nr:hypothetical protein [Gemmatimonadales bacterium]
MQIQNMTTGPIFISDMPGAQSGSPLVLPPGAVTTVFDADAAKSTQLNSFLLAGVVTNVGNNEPSTGTPVGTTPAADVTAELAANTSNDATVAAIASAALSRAGGTMTGAIAMGGNKVTGLGAPSASGDAARKADSDAALALAGAALPRAGGTLSGNLDLPSLSFGGTPLKIANLSDGTEIARRSATAYVVGPTGDYATLAAAISGIGSMAGKNVTIMLQEGFGNSVQPPVTINLGGSGAVLNIT